jgi:hypothetical protein
MITNIYSMNAYSYNSFIGKSSKLYVPVKPAAVMYSHFDHVSGFATSKGQEGVPISKIRILNKLIDQLVEMKGNRISHPATDIDPSQIDAIIKDYQTQIKTAVQSAAAAQYGLAGIKPQTGIIFNIES